LAQQLRELDDDSLVHLLVARPDLLDRPATTFEQLGARAAMWRSQLSCLCDLDMYCHQLVELVAVAPQPATLEAIAALAGSDVSIDELIAGYERLHRLGLVELSAASDGVRHVRLRGDLTNRTGRGGVGRPVRRLLGSRPVEQLRALAERLDVGSPAARERYRKPELIEAIGLRLEDEVFLRHLLDNAPEAVKDLLDQLEETGRTILATYPSAMSRYTDDPPVPDDAVGWLLARALLVETSWGSAELIAEVGLARRGGVLFPGLVAHPPDLEAVPHGPGFDATAEAGLAASRVLDLLTRLLHDLAADPAPRLKAGGIGVRVVRRIAALTDLSEQQAALLLEIAGAAGLVQRDSTEPLRPTALCESWLELEPVDRWLHVQRTWLGARVFMRLAGERDIEGKPFAPLSPDTSGFEAPEQRRLVLEELAAAPPNHAVDPDVLVGRLIWQRPYRWGAQPDYPEVAVRWYLEEAEFIGAVVAGGLSPATRFELAGDPAAAREAASLGLPPSESQVILQGDLTALAMGPLEPKVAGELAAVADVESRGSATVYRFSVASVGRALAAGATAETILELLSRCGRNEIPNPLRVLVEDVARRYGRARVAAATAYLRCDDEALLAEIVRHRRLAKLGLRQIAPTVAVSEAVPQALHDALAAAGFLPAAEDARGELVVRRPPRPPRRWNARLRAGPSAEVVAPPGAGDGEQRVTALAREAVASLRGGTRTRRPPGQRPPKPEPQPVDGFVRALAFADELTEYRHLLETAQRDVLAIDLGALDDRGRSVELVATPVAIEPHRVVVLCADCDKLHQLRMEDIEWMELIGPWAAESGRQP
jgi:hypothetical protein